MTVVTWKKPQPSSSGFTPGPPSFRSLGASLFRPPPHSQGQAQSLHHSRSRFHYYSYWSIVPPTSFVTWTATVVEVLRTTQRLAQRSATHKASSRIQYIRFLEREKTFRAQATQPSQYSILGTGNEGGGMGFTAIRTVHDSRI